MASKVSAAAKAAAKKKVKPGSKPTAKSAQPKSAAAGLYGTEAVNAANEMLTRFLPPGALGRVSAQPALRGPSGEIVQGSDAASYIGRLQGGLEGYTAPEYQASREQMMRGVQSNYATAQQQLAKAQARGKVYGAAGAAQQANLAASTQAQKDALEQDLMVKNIDERQRRLMEFGKETAAARGEQLDREKLNLGQANAETAAQLGLYTGVGGLGLSKEQNKEAVKVQREGIRAVRGGR